MKCASANSKVSRDIRESWENALGYKQKMLGRLTGKDAVSARQLSLETEARCANALMSAGSEGRR